MSIRNNRRKPFTIAGYTPLETMANERHPYIETKGWNKLDRISIVGDEDIVLHNGSKAKEMKIQGDCSLQDKRFLQSLGSFEDRPTRQEPVLMESHRGDYRVLIKQIKTEPTGRSEPGIESRTYTYTINLFAVGGRLD